MIRTLIEIQAEDASEHKKQLNAALDQLGYEPKPSPEHVRYIDDLFAEMYERGIKPADLAAAQRKKREDLIR